MGLPNFWIKFCIKKVFALEEQVLSKKKKKEKITKKNFKAVIHSSASQLEDIYRYLATRIIDIKLHLSCTVYSKIFIFLIDLKRFIAILLMVFIRKLNILRRNVKKRIELDAQCKRILIWRRIAKLGAIFLNTKKCFEETI